MRRLSYIATKVTKSLLALLVSVSLAAQPATDPFEPMRQLLAEGRYALASQVEGPNLVSQFPENADAHYFYAYALYLVGDSSKAREVLAEAFVLRSEAPVDYLRLEGILAAEAGDQITALEALQAVFTQAPTYTHASDLAQAAWQAGAYDEALTAFTRAQELADTTEQRAWALLHKARLQRMVGSPDEAIVTLEALLDILDAEPSNNGLPPPAYAQAFLQLGVIYETAGEIDKALANYEAAQLADPNITVAAEAIERIRTRATP
ncbi:MAG: tetratricopeptide repeat protein [Deinococcota bacterium]